jgi:hypothetical protein
MRQRTRARALLLAGAVLVGTPALAACDDDESGGMGDRSEPIEENQNEGGDPSGDQPGYNEP